MYRLFALGTVVLWVGAMAALFVRDVWPSLSAQNPPPMTREQFENLRHREQQYGIYNNEQRIGTAWNNVVQAGGNTTLYGTVTVQATSWLPWIRVETATEFDSEGGLDSFELNVHGVPGTKIRVEGERRGIYFPCELQIGTIRRQANLNLSSSHLIGESLRPFSILPHMKVGQSWRMQMLDPMTAVISRNAEFKSIVATVTGEETIEHQGRQVKCMVVETTPKQVKAWVAPDGEVLVQQVSMPGIGSIVLREEPFNEEARAIARQAVSSEDSRVRGFGRYRWRQSTTQPEEAEE